MMTFELPLSLGLPSRSSVLQQTRLTVVSGRAIPVDTAMLYLDDLLHILVAVDWSSN